MKTKKLSILVNSTLRIQQKNFMRRYAKLIAHHPAAKIFIENLWGAWIAFHKTYATESLTVEKLPITLLVGLSGGGKTAFLNTSKQIMPQSSALNTIAKPIAGFSMPQYYISSQQLFVELPEHLWFTEKNDYTISYAEILFDFWHTIGLMHRIKQLIFVVSLSQLIAPRETNPLYQTIFWRSLSLLVNYLNHAKITTQVAMTEVDRLQGFVEFFSDLSLEERQHAFGFMLQSQQDWLSQARQKFMMLKNRLHNRMWWRCQAEHVPARRLLVAEFPEQFQQLQQPLMRFFKFIRELQKVQVNLTMRGCYFISNFQHGNLYDLLSQQIPMEFNHRSQNLPMIPQRKSYFVRGFWQHLQLKENSGHPSRSFTFKLPGKQILLAVVGMVLAIIIVALGYCQWSWWQLKHDLNKNGALAYNLMIAEHPQEAYQAFVAYEMPRAPRQLQQAFAASPALKQQINLSALRYLNQKWHSEVFQFYQAHLQNRYPLKVDAKTSVSVMDFDQFFGNNGLLIRFYRNYLQSPVLQNYLVACPDIIKLFANEVALRQLLYQGQNQLNIPIIIYPNTLAPNVSQVVLELAGMNLVLHHDVLTARTLNWPQQMALSQSGYAILYHAGLPKTIQLNGDWSWLQLLATFQWQPTHDPSGWLLTAHDQQFSIILSSPIDLQNLLRLLPQFSITEKLFND